MHSVQTFFSATLQSSKKYDVLRYTPHRIGLA
jgi:hypothetical protein